jgi:putative thioredoxin
MYIDVTDATFETEVLGRSDHEPVVVDLWAPWCGPCKTLGPLLERVIDETEGVTLAKVNVDENPKIAATFSVQSIPSVFAIAKRAIADGFMGLVPEAEIRAFADRLVAGPSELDLLVAAGDEESLRRALELDPGHEAAVLALAALLVDSARAEEALALLARIPETPESRHLGARARLSEMPDAAILDDTARVDARLTELLESVKDHEEHRQEFIDLLEAMEETDERKARFRRALTSRLF